MAPNFQSAALRQRLGNWLAACYNCRVAISASRKVSKVVIPVAGMGTRFLPVTKALPKELLPIVNKPIIHYIVEEIQRAGIETIVFITSRPKVVIEDYFDPRDLTSYKLEQSGKSDLIDEVLELSKKIEIVSIRQYEPRGLGHAILQAASVVGGQNFGVVLGDDIVLSQNASAIGQCLSRFQSVGQGSVVGVLDVPREQSFLYGMVDLESKIEGPTGFAKVKGFVEKPEPKLAPSTWAMPGRYVFEPQILDFLKTAAPGRNGEIQLTDAMQAMAAQNYTYFAQALEGERYDTGDKLGYIIANVAVGLKDPQLKENLRAWLQTKLTQKP